MSTSYCRYLFFPAFAALIAGGCTKHVVKQEETAPVAASAAKEPSRSSTGTTAAKRTEAETVPATKRAVSDAAGTATPGAPVEVALEKIFFDFDSFLLSPAARDTLVATAAAIKNNGALTIRIDGHCDEQGSDEYNLALGEKRANAARQYLVSLGVPTERLAVMSYGEEKPADAGHDETAWAKNRRDEFTVVSRQK